MYGVVTDLYCTALVIIIRRNMLTKGNLSACSLHLVRRKMKTKTNWHAHVAFHWWFITVEFASQQKPAKVSLSRLQHRYMSCRL